MAKLFVSKGSEGEVVVLDPEDYSESFALPVGGSPDGLFYDSENNRVIVANQSGQLSVIDAATASIVGSAAYGGGFSVLFDPTTSTIFAPFYNGATIEAFKGSSLTARVDSGAAFMARPGELALDTSTNELLISRNDNAISANSALFKFDTSDLTATPIVVDTSDDANSYGDAVAYDRIHERAYLGNDSLDGGTAPDTIAVVPSGAAGVSARIAAGRGISSIAIDFERDRIVSTAYHDNQIHVFNGADFSELANSPVDVGDEPIWVAVDAERDRLIVVCRNDGTLHVLDANTLQPISGSPYSIGGNPQCAVLVEESVILNGSFERPALTPGGLQFFSVGAGQGIPGWTVTGGTGGNIAVIQEPFTFDGFTYAAQDGSQFVELTGQNDLNGVSDTGVQQTVTTTAGQSYRLSFFVGNVFDPSNGLSGQTSTVIAKVNGTALLTAVNSDNPGNGLVAWKQFSVDFTATGSSTTILLQSADPTTDTSNPLDNVRLVRL